MPRLGSLFVSERFQQQRGRRRTRRHDAARRLSPTDRAGPPVPACCGPDVAGAVTTDPERRDRQPSARACDTGPTTGGGQPQPKMPVCERKDIVFMTQQRMTAANYVWSGSGRGWNA